jgi:RNA polymerase sigma factor (sigma-70 family)
MRPMRIPSAQDLADAAAGDERTWATLVPEYDGMLRGIGRRLRLTPEEGADAAQTTWLRLVEHLHTIREPEKLAGWLAVTMRREAIRVLTRRRRERLTDDVEAAGTPPAGTPGVDARVLSAERDAMVRHAVDQLPARQRTLLRALAATPQPSYHQVASALAIPVGSVGPTRARALCRLRATLADLDVREDALDLVS